MSKARDLANAGTALTTVSATELGYLDGVTSAVQTQIDSKIGQSTAVNPSTVTTKGDILVATGSGTIVRQGVGTNGQLLSADSVEADGVKWIDAPSSAATIGTIASGTLNSGTSLTLSSLTAYDTLTLIINNVAWAGGASPDRLNLKINGSSSALYSINTLDIPVDTINNGCQIAVNNEETKILLTLAENNASGAQYSIIKLTNCKQAGFTQFSAQTYYYNNAVGGRNTITTGVFRDASAVSSLVLATNNNRTFSGTGTYQLIGA